MIEMMPDIAIAAILMIVTILMGYLGIHITLHPLQDGDIQKIRKFKTYFITLAVTTVVLIIWQGIRNGRTQQTMEADKRAERAEHKQEVESLRLTIAQRDGELVAINREQLDASRKDLSLKYVISVDVIYDNMQFQIYNRGLTDISLWGIKVNGGPQLIEKEPRMLSHGGFNYYILAPQFEKETLSSIGPNGVAMVPLELYVKDVLQRKHIVKCILRLVSRDGKLTVHTQNTGVVMQDWHSVGRSDRTK